MNSLQEQLIELYEQVAIQAITPNEARKQSIALFAKFGEEIIPRDITTNTWHRFFIGSGFDKSNSKHAIDVKCAYTNGYNFALEEMRKHVKEMIGEK